MSIESIKSPVLIRDVVDVDQIPRLEKAVGKTFGQKKLEEISLLTGGRGTSKILKFRVDNKEYACRITDSKRPDFFIDTASEIVRMSTASKMHLTPAIHYANEETGILIMDYVRDTHLMSQMTKNENLYVQFAKKLKILHHGPNFSAYTNIFTDVIRTAEATKTECMPPLARKALEVIKPLEKVLKPYQTSVPSHKELNSNNVLFDGKEIFFIDWESSANTDRFVDLAIASNFFILDPDKENVFLENYFSRRPTEKERAHLLLLKIVCLAFYAFKSMRRVTGPGKQDLSKEQVDLDKFPSYQEMLLNYFNGCTKVLSIEDFKILTYVYLREAMKHIVSPEFQKAIETLESQTQKEIL